MKTVLENVERSPDGTYDPFTPHYVAEFQYRFNRRYDLAAVPQRLLKAATTGLLLPRPILMSVSELQPLPSALPQGVIHPGGGWHSPPATPHNRQVTAYGTRLHGMPLASKASRG